MEFVGLGLVIIGSVIQMFFGIQLLILAFQKSILWGLGFLLVPFVGLIFIISYWDEAKTPFLRSLIGIPFILLGFVALPQQ